MMTSALALTDGWYTGWSNYRRYRFVQIRGLQ